MPTFLPFVPVDPLGGAPFVYRRTDTGYRLYSVGPDGIDQGGPVDDSDRWPDASEDADDMGVTVESPPPGR